MLKIIIELHSARTKKVTELTTAVISNTGHGTKKEGIYEIDILKRGQNTASLKKACGFKFKRLEKGPWDLLFRALYYSVGYNNTDLVMSTVEKVVKDTEAKLKQTKKALRIACITIQNLDVGCTSNKNCHCNAGDFQSDKNCWYREFISKAKAEAKAEESK